MRAKDGIGGYLGLEPYVGEPYHAGIALDSARSCLKYEIRLRGIRAIWLPDYLCSAVREACEDEGVAVRTYAVGKDLLPIYDFNVGENEWLYLVDYFGQLGVRDVEGAGSRSGNRLVVDEVQGFYREPWPVADTIYTCRKFFGVADGAYLCTRDRTCLDAELPCDHSAGRIGQVLGRVEDGSAAWFAASQTNEEHFAHAPVLAMSAVTDTLLRAVDYRLTAKTRERNWDTLDEELGESNLLDLQKPKGPYMYPYLVEDAGEVRRHMAINGVFVPTLWPNVLEDCLPETTAYRYAENILPLPIDQRYGVEDMYKVIECTKAAFRAEE